MKRTIAQALLAAQAAVVLAVAGPAAAVAAEATAGAGTATVRTAESSAPATSPFVDITPTTTFYQEMVWMAANGISGGWATEAGKEYRPHVAVDRDVMAAFLYRMAGSPDYTPPKVSPFVDITPATTFYTEMAWMAENGISGGWAVDAGKEYRPHVAVDRDVMAAFLYRMAGSPDYTPPAVSPFTDITPATTFYKEMAWMAENSISGGWAVGDGKEYRPHVAVDRDVMAAFLHRLAGEPADAGSAASALAALPVAPASAEMPYDREAQYGGWIDADGDCADTRDEILARDLTDVVSDGCNVLSGTLVDPYTGQVLEFVRGIATSWEVQIDHVVALGAAHETGGSELPQATRVAFANDPLNLLAVDGPTNGAKSDKDASEWLPPNEAFRCEFVARQIAVKAKYDLWVTAAEKAAMAEVLSTCPDQALPETGTTPPMPAPAPAPSPSEPYYANCAAAREAGAAPLHAGEPGYRAALDGDDDGVACES